MIDGYYTIDGFDISKLTKGSRRQVKKICDLCGASGIVGYGGIMRQRKQHNTNLDYCHVCSMKIYNLGNNNSSKRPEVRKKISENLKGITKTFKNNKNPRIKETLIHQAGYILKYIEEEKKHVLEHRLILAESLNIKHDTLQDVHHINGDKKDNRIENLIELSTSEHSQVHAQLNDIADILIQKGVILFNKDYRRYFISPDIDLKFLEKSYGFEDIAIKQLKNICNSRLDVDISSEAIRGIKLNIPLIAANMSTVVNVDYCILLRKFGSLGIMHRAMSNEDIIKSAKELYNKTDLVAMSIGVGEDQFDLSKELIKVGANIICIDIAHGYSDNVIDLAKKIKKYDSQIKIIIGNTTNVNLLYDVYNFVDAVKVGIAQGFACETKNTAGCTEKQFSAVYKFKHIAQNLGIPIISDGGIREPADFTKAIGAGANSVMAGMIFAETFESAAEITSMGQLVNNGQLVKIYAGMASEYVQNKWRGGIKEGTCAEGGIRYLPLGMRLEKMLPIYSGALKSGITYAGGKDIKTFQECVEFVRIK